jgi:hypothetical protein
MILSEDLSARCTCILADGWCLTMKRQWTPDELAEHWTLLPDELKLLANKTGATRLGFGLLLKAFAFRVAFPAICMSCRARSLSILPGR